MKRIVIHWTGGTNHPNAIDLKHYHYVIAGDGEVFEGTFTPEDNIPPLRAGFMRRIRREQTQTQ